MQRRFTREARAVAAVDHPHIIPVYDAGEAGGVLFIAMRFVAGDDLRVIVEREGGLRPHRAAAVISPVASALDAAHGAGLVHRDVKPANILVDAAPGRPPHVYLSDFGLARGMMSASGLTQAGQFLGTPDYSSPEQISGRDVDGRADQYALGCVAYALLTGSVPFRREVPMAVLYAHLSAPPPRVTAVRPDLDEAVDQVHRRAMAKEPDDRYGSCGDFADALREALGVDSYDPSRPVGRTPTGAASARGRPRRTVTRPGRSPTGRRPRGRGHGAADRPAGPPDAAAAGSSLLASRAPRGAHRRRTWTAVVAADRAYYDSVQAADDPEGEAILFPDRFPERRFRLAGTEVRIGRRSVSRPIEPEIDLTGRPRDPGVSRLHAMLTARPDGTWSVTDAAGQRHPGQRPGRPPGRGACRCATATASTWAPGRSSPSPAADRDPGGRAACCTPVRAAG